MVELIPCSCPCTMWAQSCGGSHCRQSACHAACRLCTCHLLQREIRRRTPCSSGDHIRCESSPESSPWALACVVCRSHTHTVCVCSFLAAEGHPSQCQAARLLAASSQRRPSSSRKKDGRIGSLSTHQPEDRRFRTHQSSKAPTSAPTSELHNCRPRLSNFPKRCKRNDCCCSRGVATLQAGRSFHESALHAASACPAVREPAGADGGQER